MKPKGLIAIPMTRQLYEERFIKYMAGWALLHGYQINDDLPAGVMKNLIDAVCEQIRREYLLTDADHQMYKGVVLKAVDSMRRKGVGNG